MPDTGAPWNIPFLDGTELVRAYPDFSEDLADAVADGLSAAGNAGIGSNVVAASTGTATITSSSSFVDTNVAVTITPTNASSRVLVLATVRRLSDRTASTAESAFIELALARPNAAGTVLSDSTIFIRSRASTAFTDFQQSLLFLDSPSTTSPTTYRVLVRTTTGEVRVESGSIVAIEVGA